MKYAVDVIAREVCFQGFLKLARYRIRHSLFAGGWSETISRERIESLNAAAALLYDPVRDCLVMAEQFRIGALEREQGAWTLEPVGGVVGVNEDPAEVVRREAWEEAGCRVAVLEEIGTYHVSPGTAADRISLYYGCVDAGGVEGIYGVPEECEETRVVVIDAGQAIAELFSGRIDTGLAIIGVQWLAMNRDRLRMESKR